MRKILPICGLGLLALAITACSEEEKKFEVNGATVTCNTYFSDIDAMINKVSENKQTKIQIESMKDQLEKSKKQITALPKEQQDAACQQAIDKMKQLKVAINI